MLLTSKPRLKSHSDSSFANQGTSPPQPELDHADALIDLSGKWIDRVQERKPIRELILDLDSSVSVTFGAQEGTAYNGHFGCTCYHPLFCFNQFGDLERALLREGHWHQRQHDQDGVRRSGNGSRPDGEVCPISHEQH